MSDFFSKIKSVFVVEDENAAKNQTANQPAESKPSSTNSTPAAVSAPRPVASGGAINEKFADILFTAIEKNNQEGFDYFEYKQSLKNLAKMSMDEATRYQSAFAMAQTMGVTTAKLLDSAKFYLQILVGEQAKFNEAHIQQRARLIGNREDEIKNLEATIQQKTEQIQQLTRQIEEHRQGSEKIRAEIQDSTIKIESTKTDFEVTFQAVAGQIQDDVQKMQNYLK